ncbi:MAG: CBS domain-containing protein [Bdellovibrio sp.]|nr:CBS domain-containing protein [Bdellovibrio sp.]
MYSTLSEVLAEKGGMVYSVQSDITVHEATKSMKSHNVGAVIVMNEGKPVGVFTERDLLFRVVAEGLDPNTMLVSDAMTRYFFAVKPSLSVHDAMAIVTEKRCRHLPVIENGILLGIVSSGDLTKWVADDSQVEIQHLINYITGKYPN